MGDKKERKKQPRPDVKIYRSDCLYANHHTTPIREHKSEQRTCRKFVPEAEKNFAP